MSTPTSTTTASTTSAASIPAAVLSAWQDALAAEHAAVFGYGTLGPRLDPTDATLAHTAEAAHRSRRDATAVAIAATGATPVTSKAEYPPPYPLTAPAQARQYALDLESACATAWRYLIAIAATASGAHAEIRTAAQEWLSAAAVQAVRWRTLIDPARPSVAFPGID